MLKKILLGLALVVGGFLAFAATRPDTYHVERWRRSARPRARCSRSSTTSRRGAEWSPWDKLDPHMQKSYEGEAGKIGASYAWEGNKEVGKGKMTMVESTSPNRIAPPRVPGAVRLHRRHRLRSSRLAPAGLR